MTCGEALPPVMPADASAHQDRLAGRHDGSPSDVIFAIAQVFALEEHLKALGKRARNRSAQNEGAAQRQQVLIVIEFVTLYASLNRHHDTPRRQPRSLEGEDVSWNQWNLIAN